MTKPRRRQARRHRTEGKGRRQRRAHLRAGLDAAAPQRALVNYRPRDQFSPSNGVDSLDRHISRATETEDSLDRYLRLLRFARSTTLVLATLALVGCALFGAGVGFAIAIAGLRPLAALAIGASGSTAFGITVFLRMRAYLRSGWRALLGGDPAEPTDDRREWELSTQTSCASSAGGYKPHACRRQKHREQHKHCDAQAAASHERAAHRYRNDECATGCGQAAGCKH